MGEVQAIDHALDAVASLDEDRILRSYLTLVLKTVRTNYFQKLPSGEPKPYLAVKLASSEIDLLPLPRPLFEIYVYSPRIEGVHMRAGKVARGGIRWSDRKEDFRTEILGLMKAQTVKNAVIVPVGSKGGFVVKRPPRSARPARGRSGRMLQDPDPRPARPDRQHRRRGRASAIASCRRRGSCATTATTPIWSSPPTRAPRPSPTMPTRSPRNTASGSATPLPRAVRPATTTRRWASPRAAPGNWSNAISASSGSDIEASDLTVVGVGDMSGDVFGNGMLMSRHLRLLAAFDHRHVFVDPDPDPGRSFAERERLFRLPRSSWADYDRTLISPGGGVFERGAKSIAISPQMKRAFRHRRRPADPGRADPQIAVGAGRSVMVRRHRHLYQGAAGKPCRSRRPGQ